MRKYNFTRIEKKWQAFWAKNKIYEPNFKSAKKPFYNLMMFPYPSAEGLHVGNVYAFVGSDIYGRFKRMQGYDVFEPIGLDGFGIHSENYALKIGAHPAEQAKISEQRFYKQLQSIGNSFAWNEKLETYDTAYYKWTQWIFIQLFKKGLAYRKKSPVNWCPSCKTVLADEQVINEKCERCSNVIEKKELEQWFFKITNYAEKLLKGLEKINPKNLKQTAFNGIDWSEKVKIAQFNWIGKSEGAEIDFAVETEEKPNFVLLHGYNSSPEENFFPWLKKELKNKGYRVQAPKLPHSDHPKVQEQVDYVLQNVPFNKNTVLIGHSLGGIIALKILEKLSHPIRKTVLVSSFVKNNFIDNDKFDTKTFNWQFNFPKIKNNADSVEILRDLSDTIIPYNQAYEIQKAVGGKIFDYLGKENHFRAKIEPAILEHAFPKITIFTTRPDTLFGATYMVLSPEHKLIANCKLQIANYDEVQKYIKESKNKSENERLENKTKTGVELKGIKAINPANGEKIPIWVSDYVLSYYGEGAIMAVSAHDQRDFEFAKKFKLPIKIVVCPNYPSPTCPVLDKSYEGAGYLVDSGKFTGIKSEKAKQLITEFVGGRKKIHYRLRDWLISRQRYWGPPIPMIYCEKCDWQPVGENELPIKLPYIKDFRPQGKGKSPLASVKSFYETKCPKCGGNARRETDVSDTFLDSAWYYIGYLTQNKKSIRQLVNKIQNSPFSNQLIRKWLPVNMYIGGAEHSVLHLLYTRFLAKVFYDWKLVDFNEPFTKFRAHGLLIKEGAKMSKSKGNVVNPDEYIQKFGVDALRMYLMFLAPFEQGGDFRDSGILGIVRFLDRVWKLYTQIFTNADTNNTNTDIREIRGSIRENSRVIEHLLHKTIKKVTEDIENLQYNTAVSALMILLNEMEKNLQSCNFAILQSFLKLLAPFAPHITEELWSQSKNLKLKTKSSIHQESWPTYNPKFLKEENFDLIIQINGKYRGAIKAKIGIDQKLAEKLANSLSNVQEILKNSKIKKIIFIPGKLINFVI